MDIREEQNLFSLLTGSFSVANRAGGSLLALLIVAIIGEVAVAALVFWLQWPKFVFSIFNNLYSMFLWVVFIRIITAKAENSDESFTDSVAAAPLPTVYYLVYFIIVCVAAFAIGCVAAFSGPLAVIPAIVAVYFFLRLMFAPMAIATRGQGPISALLYSWQLTRGHLLYIIGALLVAGLLPFLFIGTVGYSLYVGIPLYFADSFSILHLSLTWRIVLAAIVLIFFFILLAVNVFGVLLFLKFDYDYMRDAFVPQAQPNPNNPPTPVFGPQNNVLPPGMGQLVTDDDLGPQVQVLQSSIQTHADDPALTQHLDQVYQPQQQDFVQYTEEDRMPTILFDDDMAKQLEEQRHMWEQKQHQDKSQRDDNDMPSVKMSK